MTLRGATGRGKVRTCVDKEVRHGLGAAPLIRSWRTIQQVQQVATSNKEELTRETTVKANPALVSVEGGGGALKKEKTENFGSVVARKKTYLLDRWKDQLIAGKRGRWSVRR